ncbi:hypothetical protein BDZ90DRAFT_260323 [Jaminaea rosea]|uniref:Rad1-domain-containing protein n=1 Tax=Jaminaea rosea TaxID=1569628 RepID=A0A316UXH5_9BASI|nr:hypothetical protein BDZ90DRAFT_260323 [Jaminaea rosea]PWN27835.1 hypothetical protein BDZ90DRAFT_260323 [Jaminaea rosea]
MPTAASAQRRPDVLRAELGDVRALISLLRPISFAAVANFSISNAGIRVTTELARSLQAVAYVSEGLFKSFVFNPPESAQDSAEDDEVEEEGHEASIDFDISLLTLLECLTIFSGVATGSTHGSGRPPAATAGVSTNGLHPLRDEAAQRLGGLPGAPSAVSLRLQWRGPGVPLVLLLSPEANATSRCELSTFESAIPLGFEYHHDETQAQAIMSSEHLADAMQGIDVKACEKVQLLFTNSYEPSAGAVGDRSAASKSRVGVRASQPTSSARTNASSASSAPSLPPGQAMFKLTWDGGPNGGSSDVEFPYNTASTTSATGSVLEKFTCERHTSHWYRWAHVYHLVKGLQASVRCSLRVARKRGLLSVQLMMPKGTGGAEDAGANRQQRRAGRNGAGGMAGEASHGFLDFLIAPLDEDSTFPSTYYAESDSGDENEDDETADRSDEGEGLVASGRRKRKQKQTPDSDDESRAPSASRRQRSQSRSRSRSRSRVENGEEQEDESASRHGNASNKSRRVISRQGSIDSLDEEFDG